MLPDDDEEETPLQDRRKKKEQACIVPAPRTRRLIKGHLRVTDAWDQAILSNPATVARSVRGKKGGAVIEALLLIRPARLGAHHPACFPKISYPTKSGIHCRQSRPRSRAPAQHSTHEVTSSIDNSLNGSRRLNRHRRSVSQKILVKT